jgi:hypothetical protein
MFDAKTWGPHYWFFMTTVATTFPDFPNEISKRKYYDFYMNLPMFIPDPEMVNQFSTMLDKYPITPYLSSKDSLLRWVNFIHNKYNELLGKPPMSLDQAMREYFDNYMPKPVHLHQFLKIRRYYLHVAFILICLFLVYYYMPE